MVVPEARRVQLIKGSGTPGGHGTPVFFSGSRGAFFDMAHNFNPSMSGVTVLLSR